MDEARGGPNISHKREHELAIEIRQMNDALRKILRDHPSPLTPQEIQAVGTGRRPWPGWRRAILILIDLECRHAADNGQEWCNRWRGHRGLHRP